MSTCRLRIQMTTDSNRGNVPTSARKHREYVPNLVYADLTAQRLGLVLEPVSDHLIFLTQRNSVHSLWAVCHLSKFGCFHDIIP